MGQFKDLANGNFNDGLRKLNELPEWHDESETLDGPFFLGFPGKSGWGEGLLVASLLKRYAAANKTCVRVFAEERLCSILKHDDAFETEVVKDFNESKSLGARPPLAILKAALIGDLLQRPFLPIAAAATPKVVDRIGIAWSSVSTSKEKAIPLSELLALFGNGRNHHELICLQRCLNDNDKETLARFTGEISVVSTETLDKADQTEAVHQILSLDRMVSVSTTTAHIAASLGVPVILMAARRPGGQQWFWQAQLEYQKYFYPSVNVILGGQGDNWWNDCIPEARRLVNYPTG